MKILVIGGCGYIGSRLAQYLKSNIVDLKLGENYRDLTKKELSKYQIVILVAGQSTYVLTAAANFNKGEFYSIDLTKEARERLFPKAPDLDEEPRYHFIQGNSLEVKWDKPIDFLFIDSGHTYDLTSEELKKYSPFVKGFICMHDTGENNIELADCRRAMLDFTKNTGWEMKQLNNQNGLTIIKK